MKAPTTKDGIFFCSIFFVTFLRKKVTKKPTEIEDSPISVLFLDVAFVLLW
jgi:hypothetical protein